MYIRSEVDECDFHQLEWQLSTLQENYEALGALGIQRKLGSGKERKGKDQYESSIDAIQYTISSARTNILYPLFVFSENKNKKLYDYLMFFSGPDRI
ncbi:hypothetical protein [Methanomethylovorans sp.]|uniref:hypothetical protein n=1 Tax=Methanomethylovorans sp. TaxID=2758717 RepID=UPI00345EC5B9